MSLIFQVEKNLKFSINLQSSSADIPKRAKYTPSLFLKKSTIIQKQNQEKKIWQDANLIQNLICEVNCPEELDSFRLLMFLSLPGRFGLVYNIL